MIKVYKINLDSHFNHAKVPACLPPPSSTASSAEAAAWSSIFTLLNLMFRCLNTGKISHWCCYWPQVVLFCFVFFLLVLLLSVWLIMVSSAAFSPTVLLFIKTEPHIMTAFSNGVHRSQMPRVDADCIRKEHAEIPALCSVCHWNKSGTLISWVNQIHSSNVGELFIAF